MWLELVYPYSTELGPVRLWCAAYVAAMLIGGALFGSGFYERGDPFEVYSTLVGKLSIWGRRDPEGANLLVVRSPLANLDTVVVRPGLVGGAAVLFGSTAFDSFKDSSIWIRFIQNNETISSSRDLVDLANNLALLAFCVGVGLIFAVGTMLTSVGPEIRRRDLPNQFGHSLVPIIVGYIFAHYLTYLVEYGQQTFIQVSDPFSNGSDWFGTADWKPNYWFTYHPTLLATIKVLAVITGHVVGCDRRARAGGQAAAEEAPAHRSAPAAGGDDRLHRGRAPSPLRGLSQRRREAAPADPGATASATSDSARTSAESGADSVSVRPVTSARSTAPRSSGRKCRPTGRANPATIDATSCSDQPSVGRIRLTTSRVGTWPTVSRSSTSPRASRERPTGSAVPTTTTSSAQASASTVSWLRPGREP